MHFFVLLTETLLFRLEVAPESLALAPGNAAPFHEIAKLVFFSKNKFWSIFTVISLTRNHQLINHCYRRFLPFVYFVEEPV